MRMPSCVTSRARPIEPGCDPPTSAWCAREATYRNGAPPCASAAISVMSGRCVPPS